MKIATAQITITSDIQANGRRIRECIAKASAKGARLIHFPEGALSGYIKSQINDWKTVNWTHLSAELDHVAECAKNNTLWVVCGANHPLPPPNRPFNSLYIIDDTGLVRARYDKRLCSNTEISSWYSAGSRAVTIEIDTLRFGFILCIEVNFPHLFEEYDERAVDCVLVSSYSEDPVFGIKTQAHASNHCYWVSYAVPTQCSKTLASQLVAPTGHILCQASKGVEDILYTVIEKEDPQWDIPLRHARPWRRNAKIGKIYEQSKKPNLG